mmetsp:Transcript_12461/g.30290  ORF Transcript_12461/g.30290 Transcript_12461/m.30290 type:complete len:119 (+) Transcript_12461:527-883(+)
MLPQSYNLLLDLDPRPKTNTTPNPAKAVAGVPRSSGAAWPVDYVIPNPRLSVSSQAVAPVTCATRSGPRMKATLVFLLAVLVLRHKGTASQHPRHRIWLLLRALPQTNFPLGWNANGA